MAKIKEAQENTQRENHTSRHLQRKNWNTIPAEKLEREVRGKEHLQTKNLKTKIERCRNLRKERSRNQTKSANIQLHYFPILCNHK
jgi:hypothetical protein